jgi:PAS domain S-box-containing protein
MEFSESKDHLPEKNLIEKIDDIQSKLNDLQKEREQNEKLNYAWTGNLGHWYWDIAQNKVTFNSLKVKALGYADKDIPKEVNYQFFTKKLHPDDYQPVMDNMMEHLKGERPVYEVEYRIKALDGSWKWFHDRGRITRRDEAGKPVFMAGIVFDITKKKEYERQLADLVDNLEKENQMKNKFISVLAHDLRNPIGLLTTYMELIRDNLKEKDLDELKFNIDQIENISRNTYDLLNTLIHWAISQEKSIEVKKGTITISELIKTVTGQQEKIAARKNIRITISIPEDFEIVTDAVLISTVLRNLLSNAIKFSNEGSQVDIDASLAGDEVMFSVTDRGIGMEQKDMESLFSKDRFFESRLGTGGESGTGIGLNLSRNFVEKLGGHIWGVSKVNGGTTIFVKIPIR